MDEALLGKKHGIAAHGNSNQTMKIWVVGVVERFKTSTKQMRFEIVKARTKAELKAFIQRHVHPESVLFSDGWTGYSGL